MDFKLLYRTIVHLRPKQLFYQLFYRLHKPRYKIFEAPECVVPELQTEPIPRCHCLDDKTFTFLNLSHEFAGWDFNGFGNLWTYNQNYFDWLNQEGMTADEGCQWIDLFISRLSTLDSQLSLDPYPIALRSINWIKFFCRFPACATKERLGALYSQVKLLVKKLEYHLLGNHLLEDAFALYMAGMFFQDRKMLKKASKLLFVQLKEQILPDGAHFEQSPMYHSIMLDRLLDTINISQGSRVKGQEVMVGCGKSVVCGEDVECLKSYARRMLGHLESVVWADNTIPLLNDSALGIAPDPKQIFDYAEKLDIRWKAVSMQECGYRKLKNERMEAIVDVGNMTASYQPGHSHADTFNFELRMDGKPFIVDTGISTYEKNARRQYERSTVAHNTMTVNGADSSEVWGGFRVGRRCEVRYILEDERCVEACHDGFGKECKRRFSIDKEGLVVEDWFGGEAISYLHLAEDADENRVVIEGASHVGIKTGTCSTEYNSFKISKIIEVHFENYVKIKIQAKA